MKNKKTRIQKPLQKPLKNQLYGHEWLKSWHLPTEVPPLGDPVCEDFDYSIDVVLALDMDGEIHYRSGYAEINFVSKVHRWLVWEWLGIGRYVDDTSENKGKRNIVAWNTQQKAFNAKNPATTPATETVGA